MSGMPSMAGSVPASSFEATRDWITALAGPQAVDSPLVDRAHANRGRVTGGVPFPGALEPADARETSAVLAVAFDDVRLVSARGPAGSWRMEAAQTTTSTVLLAAVRGGFRLRREDQELVIPPLGVCLVTDDRALVVEGLDDEVQVLAASTPASRLRAVHRELSIRGPVPVVSSPEQQATLAYLGTFLVASLAQEAHSDHGPADIVTALVGSLAESAFAAEGGNSRSVEVRQAALRCIDRRHRSATFGVDDIARELYISRRQLYRAFPDAGGIAGMIAQRRLETAERLMRDQPSLHLGEVAALAGFSTAGVMRAHFRRVYGTTPHRHRANVGDDVSRIRGGGAALDDVAAG